MLFFAGIGFFISTGAPLWILAVVVLLPDFALPAGWRRTRAGGWTYDVLHTYPLPSVLLTAGVLTDYTFRSLVISVGLAWFTHIGFDRMLGRGARYDGAVIDDLYARAKELRAEETLYQPPFGGGSE